MKIPISNELRDFMIESRLTSEMNTVEESLFNNRPSFNCLKETKNLIGCEIGVQLGLNAYNILTELDIKTLYLIDIYDRQDEFYTKIENFAYELLEPYKDKIVWIRGQSDNVVGTIPDNILDFLYIDGDHQTDQCIRDIKNYYNKIKENGLIAGHDIHRNKIQKAVIACFDRDRIFAKGWDWWIIKQGSIK